MSNFYTHRPKDLQHTYMVALLEGRKTVEGRLLDEFWSNVKEGDIIPFYDNTGGRDDDYPSGRTHSVKMVYPYHRFLVTKVELFDNFGDMYDSYGRSLLPNVNSRQEAIETYENISGKFSRENVERFGCVAIHLTYVSM